MSDPEAATRRMAEAREMIGISLMGSEETRAALELVRSTMPDARITDHECFYKIERERLIELDMARLGELIGRPITVAEFLVHMASYYGRIVINDGILQIHSDILPPRFRG
ncbi:MAG TPA: MmoB/DmpM family protein [Kofleriaceae bacterium]